MLEIKHLFLFKYFVNIIHFFTILKVLVTYFFIETETFILQKKNIYKYMRIITNQR